MFHLRGAHQKPDGGATVSLFDPKFKYTKSDDMKPGYLAEKFKKLQREIEAKKKADAIATVQPFPVRSAWTKAK